MPFLTINQGSSEVQPGTYQVILTELSDPKLVTAKSGPRAGEDVELIEWTFAIEAGDLEGTTIRDSSTTATGPKSKAFGWITALLGGKPPAPNQPFEKSDLVGRSALAKVILSDSGWPKIDALVAMPTAAPKAKPAAAAAEPAAAGSMPF